MASAVTVRVTELRHVDFPREACIYAIKQLASRAGVSKRQFSAWRFHWDIDGFLHLFVDPGAVKRFRFPQGSKQYWTKIQSGQFHTTTAEWPSQLSDQSNAIPNFKIPFSSDSREQSGPLFSYDGRGCMNCAVDLPASIFLTLSRFEETFPHNRDEHDRFSAYSSIAWRDAFLHRPIVDEYGLAFAQALKQLLPSWNPNATVLRVKIGHDVDDIGRPFRLRSTLAHTFRRGQTDGTIRDILSAFGNTDTVYEHALRETVNWTQNSAFTPTVYWKSSPVGKYDRGYDLKHARVCGLMQGFRDRGVQMGVHPSYTSFLSRERLHHEIRLVREWLNTQFLGSRQDYLRWRPETWEWLDSFGLAYDASVGFADLIGFRAGTCHPYYPWLATKNCEAKLLEIPLLAMDTTLIGYMKLSPSQAWVVLRDLVAKCRHVGGVFSVVWHNTTWMNRDYTKVYKVLLGELAGSDSYDWRVQSNGIN